MKQTRFTKIELLAVSICIMVLTTLVLPMLGAAQEDATLVSCTAQLKRIAQAQQQYLNDNQGYFIPYAGVTHSKSYPTIPLAQGRARQWKREHGRGFSANPIPAHAQSSAAVPLAMYYMGGDFAPFYCPNDYRMTLMPCAYSANNSYAYHYMALGCGKSRNFPGFDTPSIKDVPTPAAMVLFAESAGGTGSLASVPEGKGKMYFKNTACKEIAHKPHRQLYNFSYVDGHVTTWKYEDVLRQKFNDGFKPAPSSQGKP